MYKEVKKKAAEGSFSASNTEFEIVVKFEKTTLLLCTAFSREMMVMHDNSSDMKFIG